MFSIPALSVACSGLWYDGCDYAQPASSSSFPGIPRLQPSCAFLEWRPLSSRLLQALPAGGLRALCWKLSWSQASLPAFGGHENDAPGKPREALVHARRSWVSIAVSIFRSNFDLRIDLYRRPLSKGAVPIGEHFICPIGVHLKKRLAFSSRQWKPPPHSKMFYITRVTGSSDNVFRQ